MISKSSVVLFDGVCLFCEGWVNFVINHNSDQHNIVFVPLQLVTPREKTKEKLDAKGGGDSIFCITNNEILYLKSDASLKAMRHLREPYGIVARILFHIPSFFRNWVYDLIGRNRYNIWGKKDVCTLPTGDRAKYFGKNVNDLPDDIRITFSKYFTFIQ